MACWLVCAAVEGLKGSSGDEFLQSGVLEVVFREVVGEVIGA